MIDNAVAKAVPVATGSDYLLWITVPNALACIGQADDWGRVPKIGAGDASVRDTFMLPSKHPVIESSQRRDKRIGSSSAALTLLRWLRELASDFGLHAERGLLDREISACAIHIDREFQSADPSDRVEMENKCRVAGPFPVQGNQKAVTGRAGDPGDAVESEDARARRGRPPQWIEQESRYRA